jgi:hypothetical protein
MELGTICRFCMAKDGPLLDLFKDTSMKAKADALLPNLKVRLVVCGCGYVSPSILFASCNILIFDQRRY